jgi:hypothetical protein
MMNGQIAENVGPLANRYVLVLELRPSREDDDESIAAAGSDDRYKQFCNTLGRQRRAIKVHIGAL